MAAGTEMTAPVTGSASGIGRGIAGQRAAQGCNIVLDGFGEAARITGAARNIDGGWLARRESPDRGAEADSGSRISRRGGVRGWVFGVFVNSFRLRADRTGGRAGAPLVAANPR